jgi:hypothetical protein
MKKLSHLWRAAALTGVALYGLTLGTTPTRAQMMENRVYEVTITNLTSGQLLSPPVLAAHSADYTVFEVGEKASEGIWTVAEQGNPMKLAEQLRMTPEVASVVVADGPIHRITGMGDSMMGSGQGMTDMAPEMGNGMEQAGMGQGTSSMAPGMNNTMAQPGMSDAHDMSQSMQSMADNSITLRIESHGADRLSVATMLGCTNDGFTGLSSVPLSRSMMPVTYYGSAYDAGTERNNQMWSSLADGCNALGPAPRDADGQNMRDVTDEPISMHPGIMPGVGDLGQEFAWHDAVVKITVQRVE